MDAQKEPEIGSVLAIAFCSAILFILASRSWPPASVSDTWKSIFPVGTGLLTLACAVRLFLPGSPGRISVRRGGLEGTDLDVEVPDRLVLVLALVILGSLTGWLLNPPAPPAAAAPCDAENPK